jgi:phenylalanyl-tRNA synthetase beta chain
LTTVPDDTLWSFERKLSGILTGLGYSEACCTSFLSVKQAEPFTPPLGGKPDSKPVAVANPLSQEQAVLRTSLLAGLLESALLNFRRQNAGVRLFEVGRIFFQNQEGRHEAKRLSLLLGGDVQSAHWRHKKRAADYFDASGSVEAILNALHIASYQFVPHRMAPFHPKRSSIVMAGARVLGWVGEIHPDLADALDTTEPFVAAELDTRALLEAAPQDIAYAAVSFFPPVHRDLSMIAPLATSYEKIAKTLRAAGGKELESVSLIDLFQSEKIGPDRKSLTVSLIFRSKEKTLTDADVEKITQKIVYDLEKKCEATLRK